MFMLLISGWSQTGRFDPCFVIFSRMVGCVFASGWAYSVLRLVVLHCCKEGCFGNQTLQQVNRESKFDKH